MSRFKQSELEALSECPEADAMDWLDGAEDSVSYLKENSKCDELVIYACFGSVFVHGVLAPTAQVTPPDGHDLQYGRFPMPDDSWGIQHSWGGDQDCRMSLEPPLSSTSKAFENGEKITYRRNFIGVEQTPVPIEISQKLVHSLGLHFVPERKAYCRLDSRGDIESVIKVTQTESANDWENLELVTILREDLDRYMALSETSLVLRFDFTRVKRGSFEGWRDVQHFERDEPDLFYHGGRSDQGSFACGAIIVRPNVTVDELMQALKDEEAANRTQYATFKIFDRKNNTNVETSCGPGFLANYFYESDLPWEVSPAFFRPEVLHRFKADPEKFTLTDRSISCRNAWSLKTYDINEAGQVHTYICYLAYLPYEEQLYWRTFNEWPKGSISERAYQTDILGQWDTPYNPLNSLKRTIRKLDESPPNWWKPRGGELSEATRYPATDSTKEWANEIMALDQLLVEGFLVKPLKTLAEAGGRKLEQDWKSVRVMKEVLIAHGLDEEDAELVIDPMRDLHHLRSVLKGHATGKAKKEAEVAARTKYGSFRAHFTQVAADCDKALKDILSALAIDIDS